MKLKSGGAKLGKSVRAHGRSKVHAAKLEDHLHDLKNGSLPKGVRPWKPPIVNFVEM